MLRTSLLLALLVAIQYVRLEEVVSPLAAEPLAVEPLAAIIPQTIDTTANLVAPVAAADLTPLSAGLEVTKTKKKKTYYPVDLIGKSKGCIMLEAIHSAGQVHKWLEPNHKMTIQGCWRHCLGGKYSYAALTNGNQCLCSNSAVDKDAKTGTTNTPCSGNRFQQCGSTNCADFYSLKINSDTLRHVVRVLGAANTFAHKTSFNSWSRFVDGKLDFSLNEIFPASAAIYCYRDCPPVHHHAFYPAGSTPSSCSQFHVVINGYEDAIVADGQITPIDVEWDFVFAREKSGGHADSDVLLYRRSLCEWVLKVDEVIQRVLSFVSYDEKARTVTLVDTKDSSFVLKVSDYSTKEIVGGAEQASYTGKWFNKIHHFKDYFKGTDACKSA